MRFKTGLDKLIRPVLDKDIPLFMHCTGGLDAVTDVFFEQVVNILLAHGVPYVRLI